MSSERGHVIVPFEHVDGPLALGAPPALRRTRQLRRAGGDAGTPAERRTYRYDPLLRRLLLGADAVAVLAASAIVGGLVGDGLLAVWLALLAPVWIVLAKLHGLYDADHRSIRHLTVDELPRISVWAVTGTIAVYALLLIVLGDRSVPLELSLCWTTATAAALLLRAAARLLWRRLTPPESVLVVGDGVAAKDVQRKLDLFSDIHAVVVTRLPRLSAATVRSEEEPLLADVEHVIVASERLDASLLAELTVRCRREHVKLSVVPPVRGMLGTAMQLTHVGDLTLVEYNTWDVSRSTRLLKRVVDVVLATIALVLFSPVFLAVALAIVFASGRPVLFAQTRATVKGRPFRMLKFRTMVPGAEEALAELVRFDDLDEPAFKIENDPRTTRIGKLLRRLSLDELPQLLNVLRGDMSLVGPRPEQVELVERYSQEQRFRLTVKPGLTGPMQVYGRGFLTFDERLAVEREYIANLSLRRDLRILLLTFAAIVSGRGAF